MVLHVLIQSQQHATNIVNCNAVCRAAVRATGTTALMRTQTAGLASAPALAMCQSALASTSRQAPMNSLIGNTTLWLSLDRAPFSHIHSTCSERQSLPRRVYVYEPDAV